MRSGYRILAQQSKTLTTATLDEDAFHGIKTLDTRELRSLRRESQGESGSLTQAPSSPRHQPAGTPGTLRGRGASGRARSEPVISPRLLGTLGSRLRREQQRRYVASRAIEPHVAPLR